MRKAAKVLNIIAIVMGFVGSVAFLIYGIICFVQAGEYGGYAGDAYTIAGGTYIGCIPLWVVYIVVGAAVLFFVVAVIVLNKNKKKNRRVKYIPLSKEERDDLNN